TAWRTGQRTAIAALTAARAAARRLRRDVPAPPDRHYNRRRPPRNAAMPKSPISRIPHTLGAAVRKPAALVRASVDDTADLLARSGELRFGNGVIATAIALTLAALCLLGVL